MSDRPRTPLRDWCLVGAVLLLALACVIRWLQPDLVAATALIPVWLWLVPAVGLIWLGRRHRLRWLKWSTAIGWIAFAVLAVEEPRGLVRAVAVPRPNPGAGEIAVRVASLNCGDGGLLSAAGLVDSKPDVVLLQEAPGANAVRELAQTTFAGFDCVSHGDLAILARGRIDSVETDDRGRFTIATVSHRGVRLEVACLRLKPPAGRIDFWTPGFWTEHRRVRETHRDEIDALLARIGTRPPDRVVIVVGDFNTVPHDAALQDLQAEFADAFARAGRGWSGTGPSDYPLFRVDQIWTNSLARPLEAFTIRIETSDHRAVVCDLAVNGID